MAELELMTAMVQSWAAMGGSQGDGPFVSVLETM